MRAKDILNEDWQKVNKSDKTDGMSSKAVKAYRRENPGSKLKTAVTTKPSKLKKGSKSAKRRKSFCARMSGMKKAHASAKTKRDPDSPINKALRRWNCESVEQLEQLLENQIKEAKETLRNRNRVVEDAEPMDREFHLVKKLGRLGQRIVQNPKLWNRYEEENNSNNSDWITSLIQDGTGATFDEVLKLSDLFSEIGGGMGRIIDFAWAVKEGTWEEDFMNPYRNYRQQGQQGVMEGKTQKQEPPKPRNFVAKNATTSGAGAHKDKKKAAKQGDVKHKGKMMDIAEMETVLEKASRQLCKSSTPDDDLGASNLASCKSQGLRARDGEKSHLITAGKRKVRIKVGGKRIKGKKYGGPLPDYGTRKGQ